MMNDQKDTSTQIMPLDLLRELVSSGDRVALYEALREAASGGFIPALRDLDSNLRSRFFKLLGARDAAHVLKGLDPGVVGDILAGLAIDDAVDILGEMGRKDRQNILSRMPVGAGNRARQLLIYGKDTAGGRMGEEFFSVIKNKNLGQVVEELRRSTIDLDRVHYFYAVDDHGCLAGVLPMRDLIMKGPAVLVEQVMRRDVVYVEAHVDQEEVARIFRQRSLSAIPVVGVGKRLIGVITLDDVAQVMEDEAVEDLLKLSGIADGEVVLHEQIPQAVFRRLPWLVLNFILNIAAVSVVAYFEGTIQAVVALAIILPMVSSMGGNAGIQTLSSTIRGLAVGSINFRQFRSLFVRESLIGAMNGGALGVILAIIAYYWKGIPFLGLIAGIAILVNIYIGGIMGAIIPMLLHRIKVDPASSAGPVLTTITDITGFFVTLKLATILMAHLLPGNS
ncbi:MAG TPA: magnesium transporter [Elusimicrobiota bacterium]|nr:magnesium transporter [Elusimicrobiota bacterium]